MIFPVPSCSLLYMEIMTKAVLSAAIVNGASATNNGRWWLFDTGCIMHKGLFEVSADFGVPVLEVGIIPPFTHEPAIMGGWLLGDGLMHGPVCFYLIPVTLIFCRKGLQKECITVDRRLLLCLKG
eukprot:c23327_g4_i1 orf=741-1115(-)